MPSIDKTKNLGQTQTTQTLAPTPYIKEQTPTQHSNPRTQTTTQQQQKSQHPNFHPRPHIYGIHRLFPMEGDKNKITKSSPPLRTAQGTWAQSDIEKANIFAEHLANVFLPNPSENSPVEEEALIHYLETPYQLDLPLNRLL
jgi:hypothetical protein